MHSITKYVALDGDEFTSEHLAIDRDRLVVRCRDLERMLRPHPDDSGARVRQPDAETFRIALVALCRELFPRQPVFQHEATKIHPFSYAGRFLDEAAPGVVRHLWWRLMCITDGYEYEQPFYALNPGQFQERA